MALVFSLENARTTANKPQASAADLAKQLGAVVYDTAGSVSVPSNFTFDQFNTAIEELTALRDPVQKRFADTQAELAALQGNMQGVVKPAEVKMGKVVRPATVSYTGTPEQMTRLNALNQELSSLSRIVQTQIVSPYGGYRTTYTSTGEVPRLNSAMKDLESKYDSQAKAQETTEQTQLRNIHLSELAAISLFGQKAGLSAEQIEDLRAAESEANAQELRQLTDTQKTTGYQEAPKVSTRMSESERGLFLSAIAATPDMQKLFADAGIQPDQQLAKTKELYERATPTEQQYARESSVVNSSRSFAEALPSAASTLDAGIEVATRLGIPTAYQQGKTTVGLQLLSLGLADQNRDADGKFGGAAEMSQFYNMLGDASPRRAPAELAQLNAIEDAANKPVLSSQAQTLYTLDDGTRVVVQELAPSKKGGVQGTFLVRPDGAISYIGAAPNVTPTGGGGFGNFLKKIAPILSIGLSFIPGLQPLALGKSLLTKIGINLADDLIGNIVARAVGQAAQSIVLTGGDFNATFKAAMIAGLAPEVGKSVAQYTRTNLPATLSADTANRIAANVGSAAQNAFVAGVAGGDLESIALGAASGIVGQETFRGLAQAGVNVNTAAIIGTGVGNLVNDLAAGVDPLLSVAGSVGDIVSATGQAGADTTQPRQPQVGVDTPQPRQSFGDDRVISADGVDTTGLRRTSLSIQGEDDLSPAALAAADARTRQVAEGKIDAAYVRPDGKRVLVMGMGEDIEPGPYSAGRVATGSMFIEVAPGQYRELRQSPTGEVVAEPGLRNISDAKVNTARTVGTIDEEGNVGAEGRLTQFETTQEPGRTTFFGDSLPTAQDVTRLIEFSQPRVNLPQGQPGANVSISTGQANTVSNLTADILGLLGNATSNVSANVSGGAQAGPTGNVAGNVAISTGQEGAGLGNVAGNVSIGQAGLGNVAGGNVGIAGQGGNVGIGLDGLGNVAISGAGGNAVVTAGDDQRARGADAEGEVTRILDLIREDIGQPPPPPPPQPPRVEEPPPPRFEEAPPPRPERFEPPEPPRPDDTEIRDPKKKVTDEDIIRIIQISPNILGEQVVAQPEEAGGVQYRGGGGLISSEEADLSALFGGKPEELQDVWNQASLRLRNALGI